MKSGLKNAYFASQKVLVKIDFLCNFANVSIYGVATYMHFFLMQVNACWFYILMHFGKTIFGIVQSDYHYFMTKTAQVILSNAHS